MKAKADLMFKNAFVFVGLSPLLLTAAGTVQPSEVRGANHPPDGPEVKHVCAVSPTVIAITLQAGQHVSNQLVPYVAEAGDEIVEEEKDKPRHAVKDGRVIDYFQKGLFRKINHKRVRVGLLSPDGKWVFIEHATKGQLLDESVVDNPAAFDIESTDDRVYARLRHPVKVFRKGKPDGFSQPLPFVYTISLQLPGPLKEGARYTIRFVGVNTSQEAVTFTYKPRQTRSIALHAIQTGYRPDDPFKRAYLSFWMGVDGIGKSGSCTHDANTFELVDAGGKTVFRGKAQLVKKAGDAEQICVHEKFDYTKAAVRRLDFSAFRTPGEYRVFVPGIGLSGPFRIAADVWEKPLKAAMQGILAQRQGVDLAPLRVHTQAYLPSRRWRRVLSDGHARAGRPGRGSRKAYDRVGEKRPAQEGDRRLGRLSRRGRLGHPGWSLERDL